MAALGVLYVASILPNTLMWQSGAGPRRKGKPLNNTGRRDEPGLISAKEVALGLPKQAWRTVKWREGSAAGVSPPFPPVRRSVGDNKTITQKLSPQWLPHASPPPGTKRTPHTRPPLPPNIT